MKTRRQLEKEIDVYRKALIRISTIELENYEGAERDKYPRLLGRAQGVAEHALSTGRKIYEMRDK